MSRTKTRKRKRHGTRSKPVHAPGEAPHAKKNRSLTNEMEENEGRGKNENKEGGEKKESGEKDWKKKFHVTDTRTHARINIRIKRIINHCKRSQVYS